MEIKRRSKRTTLLLIAWAVPLGILLWLLSLLSGGVMWEMPQVYADEPDLVITVTTNSDVNGICPSDSTCSLRTAIGIANSDVTTNTIHIIFDDNYTIVLGAALPNLSRSSGETYILGDRGSGSPSVAIDGNVLESGFSILRVTGDHWHIQGLALIKSGGFGLTLHGNYNEVRDSYVGLDVTGVPAANSSTGVLVTAGAHDNLIEGNWIGSNGNHGISLYSTVDGSGLLPSHHNTVTHNYIGTNPAGVDLGNGNKGIIIQRGSHDNYIFDNMIAYNTLHGIYLYGGAGYPPVGNRIISNTVTMNEQIFDPFHNNKRGAVVCDRTHYPVSNTIPTESSGFDNVIASNVISGNPTAGIFNVGASPLISGNLIINNQDMAYGRGIYNIVYFGDYITSTHPDNYDEDILSVPYIVNNIIDGNSSVGIFSLDTAPARRYDLVTTLNNVITPTGVTPTGADDQVRQVWYVGVEVVTGTVTHSVPITQDAAVRVFKGDGTDAYELGYNEEIAGSVIWLDDAGDTYADTTTWSQAIEFSVSPTGTLDSWMTHTLKVDLGVYDSTVLFPFDGLTETKPLSDYVGLSNYQVTGPYARYQIGEVNFTHDTDGDGIPDPVEGGDETDTDDDGVPDYQDDDSDGDGIPDSEEGTGDTDGDGIPDYQDPDDDGDGVPTEDEDVNDDGDPTNDDSDGDGIPDYLDPDDDGDGVPTEGEDVNDDGDPTNDDSDGDGIPDYLDPDDDGDGVPTEGEDVNDDGDPTNDDSDGDGIPDYLDPDDDGDGVPTEDEDVNDDGDPTNDDSDGDGIPDYLDPDDDGDGVPTEDEDVNDDGDPTNDDSDGGRYTGLSRRRRRRRRHPDCRRGCRWRR